MSKTTCVQCGTDNTMLWRTLENGQICNECYTTNIGSTTEDKTQPAVSHEDETTTGDDNKESEKTENDVTPAKVSGKANRKSSRTTRYKTKTPSSAIKGNGPRGRGRRSAFKRLPLKAPTATATVVTSDTLFYKGNYMQVGDIVSMCDVSGGTYYAQIRGFMTDEYCEKSAVVTWLLPTKASTEDTFDPTTYIIGPEEELPRKLDVMEFVMHAPSDYYKSNASPFSTNTIDYNSYKGFIWTSMESKDK